MTGEHIGTRVRYWRLRRGLSQRILAGLSGFTQGYIAQIEKGMSPLDKRSAQVAIANALQVSVADLTGQPYDPQSIEHSAASAAMPKLRAAILEASLGDAPRSTLGDQSTASAVAEAVELHNACRYDHLAPRLPGLLLALSGGNNREDMRRLVWVAYASTFAAKYLGYVDLALLAAQYCRTVAENLGETPWLGIAQFSLTHSLPIEANSLAERRCDGAIAELEPHAGQLQTAQVYGMVHLTAALRKASNGRVVEANEHLAEASRVATRTGETNFAQLWFGPTNVEIWRIGVYTELGEGMRLRNRHEIDPTVLGSRNRQATYYSDLGRGLAQTHRDDGRALAALMRAESIAPQRVRLSPAVREAVGALMRRARGQAGDKRLQGLARRLGAV